MGDGTGLEHASCIPTLCFLHTTKSITDRTLITTSLVLFIMLLACANLLKG
ncbi:BnaA06g13500D [Brassica napus]|uniref:Uncharacterized protein n=2 Tax=Brassica TaxID=3705 RepID=A0A3P6EZB3_BRAOL|nr:unnamed protein product [Brassica napus]CDY26672.1 BnaA06g13500D [Brassica napus]VDD42936.1 unnamed protein product [Brassica oleracea]